MQQLFNEKWAQNEPGNDSTMSPENMSPEMSTELQAKNESKTHEIDREPAV